MAKKKAKEAAVARVGEGAAGGSSVVVSRKRPASVAKGGPPLKKGAAVVSAGGDEARRTAVVDLTASNETGPTTALRATPITFVPPVTSSAGMARTAGAVTSGGQLAVTLPASIAAPTVSTVVTAVREQSVSRSSPAQGGGEGSGAGGVRLGSTQQEYLKLSAASVCTNPRAAAKWVRDSACGADREVLHRCKASELGRIQAMGLALVSFTSRVL